MLLRIARVLTAEEIAACRQSLSRASWGDGRVTAGHQSIKVKDNLQLAQDSADARELGALVLGALERSALFVSAALPRRIFPPLFNKYEPGMGFGAHVDNAIRALPGSAFRIRTDMSATLFLSPPEDYDGGELIVEDPFGAHGVKLPAGDMVLYPATSLHRVAPVTRGARLAAFFWIESMVREDSERTLLFNLDRAIVKLSESAPDNPALVELGAVYHNLVRKWGEA